MCAPAALVAAVNNAGPIIRSAVAQGFGAPLLPPPFSILHSPYSLLPTPFSPQFDQTGGFNYNNTMTAIFDKFPLRDKVTLSCGPVPQPYHIYDGAGLLIGGTADLAAARKLLAQEEVVPVIAGPDQTFMAVWVCGFTQASLGPHLELQFSLFVARRTVKVQAKHPLTLLKVMLSRPDVGMFCHGLWNDSETVVAYNRELLGLDARLANGEIAGDKAAGHFTFHFTDAQTGQPIFRGQTLYQPRATSRVGLALMRQLGLEGIHKLASDPWVTLKVINPVGPQIAGNYEALTYTENKQNLLRYIDPNHDTLEFADPRYQALQFQPQFVQQMHGFRFVYLNPKPPAVKPAIRHP